MVAYGASMAPYGAGGVRPTRKGLAPYGASLQQDATAGDDLKCLTWTFGTGDSEYGHHRTPGQGPRNLERTMVPPHRWADPRNHIAEKTSILGSMDLLLPHKDFSRAPSSSQASHRQPVLSPVTAALALAHQGMSSPESSAKMLAQLSALDRLNKR